MHGNTVYLAGIVADAPKGKSTGDQTIDILRQIDGFLAKAGTDKASSFRQTSGSRTWRIFPK